MKAALLILIIADAGMNINCFANARNPYHPIRPKGKNSLTNRLPKEHQYTKLIASANHYQKMLQEQNRIEREVKEEYFDLDVYVEADENIGHIRMIGNQILADTIWHDGKYKRHLLAPIRWADSV